MNSSASAARQRTEGCIVVDIGGTNLRVAYSDGYKLSSIARSPVISFRTHPNLNPQALFDAFLEQLECALDPLLRRYPTAPVGIAFPGPIDSEGRVLQAPTLWGDRLIALPILEALRNRLARHIVIQNDITAAAWRYAQTVKDDFCLITVSSGIGNKVFRQGQVLLSPEGLGGEIGHCKVGEGNYDLPCDCGGSGHLGALASGRGTLNLSYRYAELHPDKFKSSMLYERSEYLSSGQWNTHDLVLGIHQKDRFCMEVLDLSQSFLVKALAHLYHAIGVHRFLFIGGFAIAVGEQYITNLNRLMSQESWFGLAEESMDQLCSLGFSDDDHSLLGLGYYITQVEEH